MKLQVTVLCFCKLYLIGACLFILQLTEVEENIPHYNNLLQQVTSQNHLVTDKKSQLQVYSPIKIKQLKCKGPNMWNFDLYRIILSFGHTQIAHSQFAI